MEEHRRTGFDARGLVVGGRPRPLHAGALHYWRAPAAGWPALLAALRQLGCTAVDTPVPWAVHERAPGAYDWTGDRDLPAFLAAAAAAGLDAILRPGPWVEADLTFGGLPERIVRDPDIAARAAHGGPAWLPQPPRAYPLPSLASARYHAEVARWYAEVGRVLAPHLAPAGSVVALAVDHHAGAGYRMGAFDLDYHPEALRWWREEDPRDPPTRWPEPPARGASNDASAPANDDLERCVAWVRWRSRYLARGLAAFASALDAAGLAGVARFHPLPPLAPWDVDLPAIERALGGPVTVDVIDATMTPDLGAIRTRGLWASGSSSAAGPVSLACGHPVYLPPRSPEQQRAAALAAIAAGARALTVTMAVARDRWIGGALDAHGKPAGHAHAHGHAHGGEAWVGPLLGALERLRWPALHRRAKVALIASRADACHALASSVVDPAPPLLLELLGLGPGGSAAAGRDADAIAYRRWFAAAAAALELADVPYAIVDEAAGLDRLLGFDAIVAPTLHRVDRVLWRDLAAAAAARKLVVYGPDQPTHDELGRPLGEDAAPPRRAGRMRPGSVDDLAGLGEDLAALVEPSPWAIERPAGPHVDVFDDDAGNARAIIVTNPGPSAVRARLLAPAGVRLRDVLGGERLDARDGHATIALAGGDARLFAVE